MILCRIENYEYSTASHFPLAAIAVAVAAVVAVVWKQQQELEDAKAFGDKTQTLLDKTYYSFCEVFRTEKITVDDSTGAAELKNIEQHLCQAYPMSFQKKRLPR